jgi:hypothetical protein
MIPYLVYKVIHLLGNFMVIIAIGGLAVHVMNGGGRDHQWRKGIAITHGIGMFLSLLGGFGALARLGIAQQGLPPWVYAKLVIWIILGGTTAILIRKKESAKPLWFFTLFLTALATYIAGVKHF